MIDSHGTDDNGGSDGDEDEETRPGDAGAQRVVEHGAVGENDEEQQFARSAGFVLEMHDERVGHVGQPFDHGVELARAQPDPAPVEGRVRATRDDARAVLTDRDPVAVSPDPRVYVEIRLPITIS